MSKWLEETPAFE